MNFDFEKILFYATVICGLIALADVLYFAPRRKKYATDPTKLPIIIDYARSFFPVLLIVFLLRSFLFEPFIVPTGSLKPTLFTGEFILVNKYHYGIRLPVLHKKIIENTEPQRGDIMVFRFPPKPSVYYIKRVIGIPGDRISYLNKVLYVNGQEIKQQFEMNAVDRTMDDSLMPVEQKTENYFGVQHDIYIRPDRPVEDFRDVVVPSGMYFMMGDNRDDSADSRYWGFVPEENIVGQAKLIWMSWDSGSSLLHKIRWGRIGTRIH